MLINKNQYLFYLANTKLHFRFLLESIFSLSTHTYRLYFFKERCYFLNVAKQREAELYRLQITGQAISANIFHITIPGNLILCKTLLITNTHTTHSETYYLTPCLRLASIKLFKSPSNTLCVFPISTFVRKSLMRD